VNVPTQIDGHRVVLFAELPEPRANQPGEPDSVAVAIVHYPTDEDDFHLALELDANGAFIPPYDWAVVPTVEAFVAMDLYEGATWVEPPAD
jgi:hypothetical protein